MLLEKRLLLRFLALVRATSLGATAEGAGDVAVPPGMRLEPVRDPGFQLVAYSVALPTDWHLQGSIVYGTACSTSPFPVFRVTSPDGLTALEKLPQVSWRWGPGTFATKGKNPGCLAINQEVSAADLLKRFVASQPVQYVGERAIPSEVLESLKKGDAAANARADANGQMYSQLAAAKVRYRNGTVSMEADFQLFVACVRHSGTGKNPNSWWESCEANVRAVSAPEGKLEDATKKLALAGWRAGDPRWIRAYYNRVSQQQQAAAQQSAQSLQLTMQNLQAQNQQFNQSQALQQSRHEQFLQQQSGNQAIHQQAIDTMQRGTDMSLQRSREAAAANHAATSDVVDNVLGQQTVRDPTSGQTNKVSSGFNNTWIDSTGRTSLQTNDPNVNPNGVLQGTWTQQQQVHGDGTSK